MNGRDFVYWLQGCFEMNTSTSTAINTDNYFIVMEHLELAKQNASGSFQRELEIIETILSFWPDGLDKDRGGRIIEVNQKIEDKLNSFFVQVTSNRPKFFGDKQGDFSLPDFKSDQLYCMETMNFTTC